MYAIISMLYVNQKCYRNINSNFGEIASTEGRTFDISQYL